MVCFKVAPFQVRSGVLLVCLGSGLGDNGAFLVIPEIKLFSFSDDIGTQVFVPAYLIEKYISCFRYFQ